jgi:hypothetical protein
MAHIFYLQYLNTENLSLSAPFNNEQLERNMLLQELEVELKWPQKLQGEVLLKVKLKGAGAGLFQHCDLKD